MTLVVVLDVESTGKDRAVDQVIELCLRFESEAAEAEVCTWRIQPAIAIHPEATAVHGITAADLVGCPSFADLVAEIRSRLEAVDVIVGYNVGFDLDMLQAEFSRARQPPLDLSKIAIVDVLRLWHHVEPRTLVAAHEKFCGEPLEDAHRADADVAATARVLSAMVARFGLTEKSWAELASLSNPFSGRMAWVGPSYHVQWDESGAVVLGFGKHKGCPVDQVDRGFLRWALAKDFPPHVKDIFTVALERRSQFRDWIDKHYPRAKAESL